jgi:uncharacterized membrane protein
MKKHRWTKEEIAEYRKQRGNFWYINKLDTRVFVPKPFGYGITVNWANPLAWLVVAAVIGAFVCFEYFYLRR